MRALYVSCAAVLLLGACSGAPAQPDEKVSDTMPDATNPFLSPSTLPYGMPAFDQIRDEHYLPAFELGMQQQLAEIDAIAQNPEAASFDNTIVAMERSGRTLERVARVFGNLNSANTNPAMQEVEKTVAPLLAAHEDAVYLNAALFERVRSLYDNRQSLGLDAESLRLLERYYTDFVRAGALLDADKKQRLMAINSELAELQTKFGQNVLAETNDSAVVVDDVAELAGLSDAEIATAAEAAKSRSLEGKYVLALQNTTTQPILKSLKNRALRQRVHEASINRAARDNEHDNRPVIARMVQLRAEHAELLGYETEASFIIEDQTAKTPQAVGDMLAQLAPAALANAKREAAEIQKIIDAEGGGFQVEAWDWAYYAEQVRKQTYAFDDAELMPYFELDSVVQNGVFWAASQLYGIRFVERTDLPVYHPDVRVWEIFDADGKPLALFFGDFYARESKRGGAWMNQYVLQNALNDARPVIGNHLNIPKPPAGQPTLLDANQVETLFHEFGHALHGMFSDVRYPRFGGTTVPRDFVEFPSQVNEIWAFNPAVLANYAKHVETGAPIPQALVDKVIAAQQFNQGYITTEYVAAALLDQGWHSLKTVDFQAGALDVVALEKLILGTVGLDYSVVPPRYRSNYFNHIFAGGYAAGYYAYIWAEVMDADAEQWFKENGGLSRANGDKLRQNLLSRGGSGDAMELYKAFAGRDPSIEPLLLRRGLNPMP